MKKLNELNVEELKMVYENNEKLRENVFDDYCKEYLRDYSISCPIAYRDFIKTKGDYRILEDILLESFKDFTGIAEEDLEYYFIEFYIDARMEKENFYITDELELMEHEVLS